MSEQGQKELLEKARIAHIEGQAMAEKAWQNSGTQWERMCLSPLSYANKQDLSPMSPGNEGWEEIEMTADSGACDTVMPRKMCSFIPIVPSMQSMREMEYEVANGANIPNLGERRCMMWTEGASAPRGIAMQVADVHKPLLSLSRCADLGYESRFGKLAGALIDNTSGEVIPLVRKGNLYVFKAWVRAATFGRPE